MAEPVIMVDPEVMNGTPCFRGTRVPFKNLIDYLDFAWSNGVAKIIRRAGNHVTVPAAWWSGRQRLVNLREPRKVA